ncbi:MAG: universal stress protein [Sphingobacteriales bacterium]|nr:MAG: universal stress protein [Sphingobacteriales bacterium]
MKQILVPTDFSENALNAYTYALHIADKLNIGVTTLHTYTVHYFNPADTDLSALQDMIDNEVDAEFEVYKKAATAFHQHAEKIGLGHISINHLLRKGFVSDEVEDVVNNQGIDLVVMGTKGINSLKDVLFGSNTADVVKRVKCPVLTVPAACVFKGITKIVYATNCDEHDEKIIDKVYGFAQAFNAPLKCVHVSFLEEAWNKEKLIEFERLSQKAKEMPMLDFEVVESESVLDGLKEYMTQNEVSIVAMHTHKRTFFEKIFLSSYTEQMAYHSHLPLLSFGTETSH